MINSLLLVPAFKTFSSKPCRKKSEKNRHEYKIYQLIDWKESQERKDSMFDEMQRRSNFSFKFLCTFLRFVTIEESQKEFWMFFGRNLNRLWLGVSGFGLWGNELLSKPLTPFDCFCRDAFECETPRLKSDVKLLTKFIHVGCCYIDSKWVVEPCRCKFNSERYATFILGFGLKNFWKSTLKSFSSAETGWAVVLVILKLQQNAFS